MSSKDVEDRAGAAHSLTAMIEQLAGPIAAGLGTHLSSYLRPGETLPDLVLMQRLMGRLVTTRLHALSEADLDLARTMSELEEDLED